MKKPVKLSVVRSERKHADAKDLRREMFSHLRTVVQDCGDDVAGYAIVVWDKDGYNWSTLKAGGPVKTRFAATFVHDAVQQHAIVDLVDKNR